MLLCLLYPVDPSVFLVMNRLPDRPKNMRPDTALVSMGDFLEQPAGFQPQPTYAIRSICVDPRQ